MRKMAPKVEEELRKKNKYFGLDFKQNLPDEEEVTTKKIFNLHKQEKLVDVCYIFFKTFLKLTFFF